MDRFQTQNEKARVEQPGSSAATPALLLGEKDHRCRAETSYLQILMNKLLINKSLFLTTAHRIHWNTWLLSSISWKVTV